MKKTVTYLLCATVLLLTLTACGSDKGKVTPKPTGDIVVTSTPLPTVSPAETILPQMTASPNVSASPSAAPGAVN